MTPDPEDMVTLALRMAAATGTLMDVAAAEGQTVHATLVPGPPSFDAPSDLCAHAMESVGPYYVWLGELTTGRCSPCLLPLVEAAIHSGCCDWCGEAAEWFHPLMVQMAPYIFMGEVCGSCLAKARGITP